MLDDDLIAVLFDAGGTLVRLDYEFIARVAQDHGIEEECLASAEASARLMVDHQSSGAGLGTDASRLARYLGDMLRHAGVPEAAVAPLSAEIEAEHRAANLWRVAIDGALETLRGLAASGLRLAVVSNADGRVEQGLTEAGLTEHLEFVIDSHLEGVEKPDPEIFRRALRRLGVSAERSVYVGDIYSIDATGSRSAGMQPVILDVAGGYDGLDCPVIRDLRELLPGRAR